MDDCNDNSLDFQSGCSHCCCPRLLCGMLGASILVSLGGRFWHPGEPREQQKRHLGVQCGVFINLGWNSGPQFESKSNTLEQIGLCFPCLLPGCSRYRFAGLNLVVWSLEGKHLVWEVLQKLTFRRRQEPVDFRVLFSMFVLRIRHQLSWFFGVLETSLKFIDFHCYHGVILELE